MQTAFSEILMRPTLSVVLLSLDLSLKTEA